MDHPHYTYSPIGERSALAWPQGKRIAFWVLLPIEHWELQPPEGTHREPRFMGDYGSFDPDYATDRRIVEAFHLTGRDSAS